MMPSGRRLIRRAGAAIAGFGCAAVLVPAANGAMTYSATGPSTLTFPGVQTVSASLTFENTGSASETVEVGTGAPEMQFPRVGTTMDPQGSPKLENLVGTSMITSRRDSTGSYPASACLAIVPDNSVGVYGDPSHGLGLLVPAGARGVVTQRFRVGDFPARPGDAFAARFYVADGAGSRLVAASEPQLFGPSGIQFTLTPSAKRKRLVVSGSTVPGLDRQLVNIRMTSIGSTSSAVIADLGSVRTDSQGRFHLKRKLPKKAGTYLFAATHNSSNPAIASDSSCATSTILPARPKAKKKGKKKLKKKRRAGRK